MKRALKWLLAIVLTPVVLFLVLTALLYVPPVQNWVVQRVASAASEATGFDISVGHVSLKFPLDLRLDDVMVVRPESDTIAVVGSAVADVRLWPLLESRVVVDRLDISQATVNTFDLISDVQVKGSVGEFSLHSDGIDLNEGTMLLNDARLADADITIQLSDTAAVDTTASEPLAWLIDVDRLDIANSAVSVSMPGDSMHITAYMGTAAATAARINLADGHYTVGHLDWRQGRLSYDLPYESPAIAPGVDYNHLLLTEIGLGIDSIDFIEDPLMLSLNVSDMALKEQSGLCITDLHGPFAMDANTLHTDGLTLKTPHTTVYTRADVDLNVMDEQQPGQMNVYLDAQIGRHDIALLAADALPDGLMRHWPDWPLSVRGSVKGNMKQATLTDVDIELPTALHLKASGTVNGLDRPENLLGQLSVSAQTFNLDLIRGLVELPQGYRLPPGIVVAGTVDVNGQRYAADLTARQGKGRVDLKGYYDVATERYAADATISNLNLHDFMPADSLYQLTADISLDGRGTDFLNPQSRLSASADIHQLRYGRYNLTNMQADALLSDGHARAHLSADNELLSGCADVDALLSTRRLRATIGAEMGQVDMMALGLADHPLTLGLCGHFDMDSDLKDSHQLTGLIGDFYLRDSVTTYRPEDIGLRLVSNPDTTLLRLQSGNLILKADAQGSYEPLLHQLTAIADTVQSQFRNRIIDQQQIKQMLPTMHLYVTSGNNNPIANMLRAGAGINFKDLLVDMNVSPQTGLNGKAHLYALQSDSLRIDSIHLTLKDTDHGLTYQAQVENNRRNPQFVFKALLDGHIYEHGLRIGLRFYDAKGELGVRLGAQAQMEESGISFKLLPKRPTIGYTEFNLNDDNYLFLGRNMKLQANVDLVADDGTGVKIYSANQDSTLVQDLTVSLNHFNLDHLTAALPFVPHVGGILDGDYHLMMNADRQISVATDMQVKGMTYENSHMGDIATEFVYLQREDDTHALEGIVMLGGKEVAALRGSYQNRGEGQMDATLTLTHMPLGLVNGFIDDQLLGFEGYAEGEVSVKGSLSHPKADGELYLDSAYMVSQPYGVRLRFDNDPVRIIDSKLLLENFTMYAHNQNPLNIMGDIDFHDTDRMTMNLRMRAQNFLLINSKQTARSVAYGKMFVNFFAMMNGPMDHLAMRGKLDVLGTTDLTYLLLDSPLSTDNQMDELVKFTDFKDSIHTTVVRPEPEGLTMDMTISVDRDAHVKCGLNADQTNYVNLYGGGDLRMRYQGSDLMLTGRYTLTSGTMKYSLPVIPLKTFTIQDGSYVEFTGDPMNPTLNITATERTRAEVGTEESQSRNVTFDCGVVITRTLSDMGLQFTISAPEDISINSELASMTAEERGKLAVTMLTTGMYLADGNTSAFSMNSALSTFLESEINNITAGALKTLDLNIGLDNSTDASGQMHTDYSFSFAKRFWNNRLRVQVGGKVSTGQEAMQGQNQSFFDNVTMEYRLSQGGNQYVKLFYNQNAYDWLDGYTGEYGAGFIWKRKLDSFWDIFRFKNKPTPSPSRREPTPNPFPREGRLDRPSATYKADKADTLNIERSDSINK